MAKAPGKDQGPFWSAYQEGLRLFQAKQFEAALGAFAKAINLNKTDTCSWEMFGGCLGNLGRYEESLRAFDRVRQLGHECPSCCTNRAIALIALRRPEEAREALERALELDPASVANWYDLGRILGMSYGSPDALPHEPFDGRHEEAVAAFDRALELDPKHHMAWFCKGFVLYKLSHSQFAHARAVEATGVVPDFLAQARSCLRQALALYPAYPQAQELLAEVSAALDQRTAESGTSPGLPRD